MNIAAFVEWAAQLEDAGLRVEGGGINSGGGELLATEVSGVWSLGQPIISIWVIDFLFIDKYKDRQIEVVYDSFSYYRKYAERKINYEDYKVER